MVGLDIELLVLCVISTKTLFFLFVPNFKDFFHFVKQRRKLTKILTVEAS
jgi:hypothetical protein